MIYGMCLGVEGCRILHIALITHTMVPEPKTAGFFIPSDPQVLEIGMLNR